MTAPSQTPEAAGLEPCPFCGGEASVSTYDTESLWSHDIVTYTRVGCDECDISFNTEPGYELEAAEAWNRRSAEGGWVPADVVRLVVAARRVAFENPSQSELRELDIASEAFASRVPWDDAPDEIPAAPTGAK